MSDVPKIVCEFDGPDEGTWTAKWSGFGHVIDGKRESAIGSTPRHALDVALSMIERRAVDHVVSMHEAMQDVKRPRTAAEIQGAGEE